MIDNFLASIRPDNFTQKALEVFRYQAEKIPIYKSFLEHLKIKASQIDSLEAIPFLPISFFKTHSVFDSNNQVEAIFTSSGTTGMQTSKHYISDLQVYEQSFMQGFESFFGDATSYCFLALLPSYLEREGSSLIYMCNKLIEVSKHPDSGFYLHNISDLVTKLEALEASGQKTILIGVSYALLDLVESYKLNLKHTKVMETGGMKGQRKEMVKEEFYAVLKEGLGVRQIYSEYGMTELLSQAYSFDEGKYHCPQTMQVMIRDTNDPFSYLPKGKSGGINIIDLANINSCSFIATQDLGKINKDGTFSVLGRFDNSDIRGCNLMIA